MKKGYLSEYFEGAAFKVLSSVEADVLSSNQHEFNGVEGLRRILSEPDGKVRYAATFLYLTGQCHVLQPPVMRRLRRRGPYLG